MEDYDKAFLRRSSGALSRRDALAAIASITLCSPAHAEAEGIKALVFDGFPIFDPRPIGALARRLVPEKGDALAALWSSKLFASTWLVTAGDRYVGFESLAEASLRFAAETLKIDLSGDARAQLVGAYSRLDVWPDVKPALTKLKEAGIRLGFLSNLSETMLHANMEHAGISEFFEVVLSTDRVRRFKPAPITYAMALDAFGLPKNRIGFVAFGGWDAVGATWFGYKTAWINRLDASAERLDGQPAIVTPGIEGALMLAEVS